MQSRRGLGRTACFGLEESPTRGADNIFGDPQSSGHGGEKLIAKDLGLLGKVFKHIL